jgi:glucose-1-phosphate thymidylyltransferase
VISPVDPQLKSSEFNLVLRSRQGQLIASPEEIADRQRWIDRATFEEEATKLTKTRYGRSLLAQLHSLEL